MFQPNSRPWDRGVSNCSGDRRAADFRAQESLPGRQGSNRGLRHGTGSDLCQVPRIGVTMKILTAGQMAEVDRLSTELFKIPSLLLMENAGRAVVDGVIRTSPGAVDRPVQIFCGRGNNGGDGLAAARHLAARGGRPQVFLLSDPASYRGDALANWEIVHSMGIPVRTLGAVVETRRVLRSLRPAPVIVDALFGTGLSKPIGPEYRPVVSWINRAWPDSSVVSVDIPSGLFADSSLVSGAVVRARLTVTFTALKPALVLAPASEWAGKVTVVPIGSPPALLENPEYRTELIDRHIVRGVLPPRPRDSHKGAYGHVFVVAGSAGKSGAAIMTGQAALRSGAGLVTLLLPSGLQRDIIARVPELMSESLPETRAGTLDETALGPVLDHLKQADAVVVGPGLTTHPSTRRLVRGIVRLSPVPMVLDADGINAFAPKPETLRNEGGQAIAITPHPGEMARLLGCSISEVQSRRLETAVNCAREHGLFTVLKGFQTIVAAPDGRTLINSTGNPGMATGGSGDILAGMAGRFVAGWNRKYHNADLRALGDALAAAVYLHGMAGDIAAVEMGEEPLTATDLIGSLPPAFKSVYPGEPGAGAVSLYGAELEAGREMDRR
jgi:ADP-dependent NAD(P)H-hydrate dehydratase / NAD(P)H-hydrate epimerase